MVRLFGWLTLKSVIPVIRLSASNASLAGTILSLLLRIAFDTAAVGWGLRQYELSR